MSVHDAIVANAIEGLKKKPVLVVHLLVAVALASFILWCDKLFVNSVLGCSLCALNFNILIILALIAMSLSLGFYVNFWHNLRETIRNSVPSTLDEALNDYTKFIQSIMDKTIYHFIREYIRNISIRGIAALISSYYLTWITGLYSIDLILYTVSKHRYTMFGYMLENAHLIPAMFLAGLVLAQFIRPWHESKEEHGGTPKQRGVEFSLISWRISWLFLR